MSDFTGVFGNNQGILQTLQRDNTNSTLPILLRTTPTLPAAPSVSYPIATNSLTNILNAFDANLQIPYTQSYTIGWQRKLGRDTALEIRYVGSRHRQDWETIDLNGAFLAPSFASNQLATLTCKSALTLSRPGKSKGSHNREWRTVWFQCRGEQETY